MHTLHFRFRPSSGNPEKGIIYFRIRKDDGKRTADTSTGIRTDKHRWKNRKRNGLGDELKTLEIKLLDIAREVNFDPELVVENYRQGKKGVSIARVCELFLMEKKDNRQLAARTHETYLAKTNLLKKYDKKTPIRALNEKYANGYVAWLKKQGYSHNYSMKQIEFLKSVSHFAVRRELVNYSKLSHFRLSYQWNDIEYLGEHEIKRLIKEKFHGGELERTRKYFLFQIFTGLAYSDLVDFDAALHIRKFNKKVCLVGKRQKSNKRFFVPLEKTALEIIDHFNGKLPYISNAYYNRCLKELGGYMGFSVKLTTHVARKTAGMRWLNMGYSIESVSVMLGHSSIQTTEKWYARVLPERIMRESEMVGIYS